MGSAAENFPHGDGDLDDEMVDVLELQNHDGHMLTAHSFYAALESCLETKKGKSNA